MRRARRTAVGVLLAFAVGAPTPSVQAKAPDPRDRSQNPADQKVVSERKQTPAEGHPRLEEMKVELALLADTGTFPYYLSARAVGDTLELRGFVPNEIVRQHALDVARRSTSLKVSNKATVPANLAAPPPMRSAPLLQWEAAELLRKSLGEQARLLSVGIHPGGVIVVAGPIDSVESKLAISRLLRRLSGCHGVLNALLVQPVLHDGRRMVQVTRDGSMVVPLAALGLEPKPIVASPPSAKPAPAIPPTPTIAAPPTTPAPYVLVPTARPERPRQMANLPEKKPSVPVAAQLTSLSTSLPTNRLAARKDEARLPAPVPPKPAGTPRTTVEKSNSAPSSLNATKLPVKWGQPAMSWESQVKKLQPVNAPPVPPASRVSGEVAKMPTPVVPRRPDKIDTRHGSAVDGKTGKNTSPTFAETRRKPEPGMSWRRPGSEEGSAAKVQSATKSRSASPSAFAEKKQAVTPVAAWSSRRWPPAYEPASKGRVGVIIFEDDSPSSPRPALAAVQTPRPILPANLQRQVKSVCGRNARDVTVETRPDGVVLVKVKVPSLSVEDQLTRKILAIPEMTSPKVRLIMDVNP